MRYALPRIILLVALITFGLALTARAQTAAPSSEPAARANGVADVETYLQTLDTVQARFIQTAPDGTQASGIFYLDRPGKLRFEYDPPLKDFVVADGTFIYFYDGQVKQQTNAPIGQTLADFLLRKNLKLSGDITVTRMRRAGGLLQVTAVQTADPKAGHITLGFTERPQLALKKWRVLDAQGQVTEVELFDARRNMAFPDGLFSWRDPNKKTGGVNR